MRIEKDYISKNIEDFLRSNLKKMQESVRKNPSDERLRAIISFYKNSLAGYEIYKDLIANDKMTNRSHAVIQAAIEVESYYSTGVDTEAIYELMGTKNQQDVWWIEYIKNRCSKYRAFFDKLRMFELVGKLLKDETSANGDAIFWLREKMYNEINESACFVIKFKLFDEKALNSKMSIPLERIRPLEYFGGQEFMDKFKAIMTYREKEFGQDKYRTMAYESYVS